MAVGCLAILLVGGFFVFICSGLFNPGTTKTPNPGSQYPPAASSQSESGPKGSASQSTPAGSGESLQEKTIRYEVLKKEKRRLDGKLVLDVLVDEAASKPAVLNLAESLRREHAGKYATISIFDSREVWRHYLDEATSSKRHLSPHWLVSEKELSRHWLVVVDWGGDTGEKEAIRWVAEGRDQQEGKRATTPKSNSGAVGSETKAKPKLEAKADPESKAKSKLASAKLLLEKGNRASAKKWLQDILSQYPETEAAEEAKVVLEDIDRQK